MTLRPLLPAILLALVMSIVVGVLATGRGSGPTLAVAVGLFVLQIGFATLRVNALFWNSTTAVPGDGLMVACAFRNTVLAALVYTWGATAMLAIYSMSSLNWRHWWQYGTGMAVIAVAILLYAYFLVTGRGTLRTPRALDNLMILTVVQGIAMAIALGYLVLGGKLLTQRDDWVANYIFIAGTFMLAVLSFIALLTYRKLKRRPSVA